MQEQTPFNVEAFRDQFPILAEQYGVYLDSAATTLTPKAVIDAEVQYYATERATVGRSDYRAAINASQKIEAVRERLSHSLNKPSSSYLIFCPGATAALNIAAQALSWQPGDNIITTIVEHSSNFLPWLRLHKFGIEIRIARPDTGTQLNSNDILSLVDAHTRLIAVTHVSNVTGEELPIQEITAEAHRKGILCVVDGAQAFGHLSIDLTELDCDVYAASAHKAFGPTGIGFLALSERALEQMAPPWVGGGMVNILEGLDYTIKSGVSGWEAGTPNVSGILGFGASLPIREIAVSPPAVLHTKKLVEQTIEGLNRFPEIQLLSSETSSSIITFSIKDQRPHRVSSFLDETAHIMLRAGLIRAIPLHQDIFARPHGSLRVSLAPYNTQDEINLFLQTLCSFSETYAKIFSFPRK